MGVVRWESVHNVVSCWITDTYFIPILPQMSKSVLEVALADILKGR